MDLQNRQSSLNYDHVLLKPKEQIGLHQHDSWELSYIMSGKGKRTIGNRTEPFEAGEVVLVVPEMPHRWAFSEDCTDAQGNIENISLSFPTDLPEQLASVMPELHLMAEWYSSLDSSILFKKGQCQDITDRILQMGRESGEERMLSLITILLNIYRSRCRSEAGKFEKATLAEQRLKNIFIFLRCNYARPISIEDLARHVKMNHSALCTFFKKQTGRTIFNQLIDLRLKSACHLLQNRDLNIGDICYRSGFNDIPYFTRLFKKHIGLSPHEYREMKARKTASQTSTN